MDLGDFGSAPAAASDEMMFAGQGSGLLFAEMASDAPQNELSADAAPLSAPLSAPHSAPLSAPLSAPHAGAAPSQSGGLPDKSALFATPAVAVNDAALRAWRAQHNETLKKEAAEAQKRADDELARAKAELDKMTAAWEAKKKKNHERNVVEEKKFVAERDAAAAAHGWSNVARYADLKGIEAGSGSDRDTARMREVLAKSLSRK